MTDIPEGFYPIDLGEGYGRNFGTVYGKGPEQKRTLAFRVGPEHCNFVGFCHGGALAMMADMQLMAVQDSYLLGFEHTPTISLEIDYIAPVSKGSWVELTATLTAVSRTMAWVQSVMRVGEKIVVQSSAKYHLPNNK
jgi:uncharacterized protein (TIGR00369 family)